MRMRRRRKKKKNEKNTIEQKSFAAKTITIHFWFPEIILSRTHKNAASLTPSPVGIVKLFIGHSSHFFFFVFFFCIFLISFHN